METEEETEGDGGQQDSIASEWPGHYGGKIGSNVVKELCIAVVKLQERLAMK